MVKGFIKEVLLGKSSRGVGEAEQGRERKDVRLGKVPVLLNLAGSS